MDNHRDAFDLRKVHVNGVTINLASAGEGPAVLFVHGWPHTWRVWLPVMELMKGDHTVLAMDLRGLGDSEKAPSGYDLQTLADDAVAILDALQIQRAHVVGIDLGVAISFMLAMRHPSRVRSLSLMEGLLGALPGAGAFMARGAPWWFGFHGVPGLAETVLQGHEAAYVDWFLKNGTKDRQGIAAPIRDAFVDAYSVPGAMRCGFEHYRAFPQNTQQLTAIVAGRRAVLPVLALAGGVVGDALAGQLRAVCGSLREEAMVECAHLIPLEKPVELSGKLRAFIAEQGADQDWS